jgi:spermidine synthase
MQNRILIFSVFIVASCGLAYELVSAALASYLLGDSIFQFSSIIGCYLFAMGVGSHLSKHIRDEDLLRRFIDIELLVGLAGGLSASLLFVMFAWAPAPFRAALYLLVFCVGLLVGMEIPLVMRILNARKERFADMVSRVLTFDYLGALVVSLLFPLLLAPKLGLGRTALVFGLLNAAIAAYTLHTFRGEISGKRGLAARAGGVIVVLGIGLALSNPLTHWIERELFQDEIVHAVSTPYQRLVVTQWQDDTRLYINGYLQFSSRDEHRYHEALVHPALENLPAAKRILVIGGGDGFAVREVLKYPLIEKVVLVDIDKEMTNLFSTSAVLTKLNQDALKDKRVVIVNEDAAQWLERANDMFDAAIVDLPDPSNFSLGKLYSVPIYRLLARHVSERGLIVVQAGSPYYTPRVFWSIDATLKEAGLKTWPYHAYVPSFGEWGFIAASRSAQFEAPANYRAPTRFLNAATTAQMFQFPPDLPRPDVLPNRLDGQPLVSYFEEDWRKHTRR